MTAWGVFEHMENNSIVSILIESTEISPEESRVGKKRAGGIAFGHS